MPKPTSNDVIVQRHRERRDSLIAGYSKTAAEKIMKLKKPTVEQVAEIIASEFKSSAI